MDELKLILEAGDNAKAAAFAYFAVDLIGMLLVFIAVMITVALVYKLCSRSLASDRENSEMEKLAEILGTKKSSFFFEHERKATHKLLRKLAEEHAVKEKLWS